MPRIPTTLTPGQFLKRYPPAVRGMSNTLRALMKQAAPMANEYVYIGWKVLGYRLQLGGKKEVYFAFILPHANCVTIGFEHGRYLRDPHNLLLGAAPPESLKRVRYLTFYQPQEIQSALVMDFVAQAAQLALSR